MYSTKICHIEKKKYFVHDSGFSVVHVKIEISKNLFI